MSDGYSTDTSELRNGSSRVQGLRDRGQTLGMTLAEVMSGLAGAAGDSGVAGALASAAEAGARVMLDTAALLDHVGNGLVTNAQTYDRADQGSQHQASQVMRGME